MSSGTATIEQPEHITETVVREAPDPGRPSWAARIRSADHKSLGTTLIGLSALAVVVAGMAELLTLLQMALPDNTFLPPERFLRLHTLSDITYLYFFALPGVFGLALYVLPLQIGARGTALPRLAQLGTWSIVMSFALFYGSIFISSSQAGPFLSVPLINKFFSASAGIDFALAAHMIFALGATLVSIDLLTTFRNMRAPGMTRDIAPAFAFAAKIFAFGALLTAPVLFVACGMMIVERESELVAVFDPSRGGSALLWQVLYSWFAHAAPLLVGLAGVGVAADIFATFGSGRVALRKDLGSALVGAMVLAVLGFGQWLYGAPVDGAWIFAFMLIGLAMAIPASVILASLVRTVRASRIRVTVPVLYAIGFVALFTVAIVDAIGQAIPAIGQWTLGSELGYAHWQMLVVGCGLMTVFGGLHYWFPKITGRMYGDGVAKVAWAHIFFGTFASLLLAQSLGVDGFARELSEYADASGYQTRWVLLLLAFLAAAFGVVLALLNLAYARVRGRRAGNDPWHGSTLEWYPPSPPPAGNFDEIPEVRSDTPLADLRMRLRRGTDGLAGSVAQPPTAGRPALRETHH